MRRREVTRIKVFSHQKGRAKAKRRMIKLCTALDDETFLADLYPCCQSTVANSGWVIGVFALFIDKSFQYLPVHQAFGNLRGNDGNNSLLYRIGTTVLMTHKYRFLSISVCIFYIVKLKRLPVL